MAHSENLPPWFSEYRQALERVTAAQIALDRTKPGTLEREAANRERDEALAAFRAVAQRAHWSAAS